MRHIIQQFFDYSQLRLKIVVVALFCVRLPFGKTQIYLVHVNVRQKYFAGFAQFDLIGAELVIFLDGERFFVAFIHNFLTIIG